MQHDWEMFDRPTAMLRFRGIMEILSPSSGALNVLGMTGRFLIASSDEPEPPHTHAVFHLDGGAQLRYVDPRRFGPYTGKRYLVTKNEETYRNVFTVHYPDEERPDARPAKTSPVYEQLKRMGAAFGVHRTMDAAGAALGPAPARARKTCAGETTLWPRPTLRRRGGSGRGGWPDP